MYQKLLKICFLFLLIFNSSAKAENYRGVVVLIPGTLNSLIPGGLGSGTYFSQTIIDTFEDAGLRVFIPTNLLPTGAVEENGLRVYRQVKAFYDRFFAKAKLPIYVLGHSAGGLYGLDMISRNDSLPIKKIMMISTPLNGTVISDIVFGDCILGYNCNTSQNLATDLVELFGSEGLAQMGRAEVQKFTEKVRLPDHLEVATLSPVQGQGLFERSGFVCPMCASSNFFFDGRSDGVVGIDSSMGRRLLSKSGKVMKINAMTKWNIRLGHHEQVLDSRLLVLLFQSNVLYVQKEQRRAYELIKNYFLSP